MKLNIETKQLESIETYNIEKMVELCDTVVKDAEKQDSNIVQMSVHEFQYIMKAWYYILELCKEKEVEAEEYKPKCFGNYEESCYNAACGYMNKCRAEGAKYKE